VIAHFIVSAVIQMILRRKLNLLEATNPRPELAVRSCLVDVVKLCPVSTVLGINIQPTVQAANSLDVDKLEVASTTVAADLKNWPR
jgi:hypothetical protein